MSDSSSTSPDRTLLRVAAIVLFLGVSLGAFAAHGLKDFLQAHDRTGTWDTAVLYHLVHGVGLLALALALPKARGPFWSLLTGIVLFSGSLYLLSLTEQKWLVALTPFGGVSFLLGWGWLACRR